MIKYTNNFLEINDGEIVIVKKDSVTIEDKEGNVVERESFSTNLNAGEIDKGITSTIWLKKLTNK